MQNDLTSSELLADYTTLGKLHETWESEQRICKLQVKNNQGYHYLEFSAGDISTTAGWITQIVTRNCNQLLGTAGANRKEVIDHLHHMNQALEKYLTSLSEKVKITPAKRTHNITFIRKELQQIKLKLEYASKGIAILKKTYSQDTLTYSSLEEVDLKIVELSHTKIQNVFNDINHQLQALGKRKMVKIDQESEELAAKEKELYDRITALNHDKVC